MLADRRIDAHRDGRVAHHLAVDSFSHAVQALHLEARIGALGHVNDRGDGAGVVGRELWVDHVCVADQRLRAGQVADVGVVLVGEHWVASQAQLLRALDLAVPVRALDQPHHETQAVRPGDAGHLVDHFQRACLVGLHRQAETAPVRKVLRDARRQRGQHVERQFQPIAFFGVDGQVDVGPRGGLDQLPHARQQLGKNALALRVFVAREQRAQLDRNAIGRLGSGPDRGAGSDGVDGIQVRGEIALRIGFGARAFAQHVVAEAQAGLLFACGRGLAHRLGNRAAQHELPTQQLDRAHGGADHRLRAQPLEQTGVDFTLRQELFRQADGTGRQRGEHLVRAAGAGVELRVAELVGRQRDGGLGVGHAQQRFGQPHQRQAFGAGNRVLAQQRFHGPERRRVVAHRLHPGPRGAHRLRPVQSAAKPRQQGLQGLRFVAVRRWQPGPSGRCGRQRDRHGKPLG